MDTTKAPKNFDMVIGGLGVEKNLIWGFVI